MSNDSNLTSDLPWLNEKNWQNGQIHSGALGAFYLLLFFTLFWNAISFAVAFFVLRDTFHGWEIDHLDPALFVLLFPVVGLSLFFWSYKAYRQWAAFGRLSLTLTPFPGSIGGDIGGFLELPVQWRYGYEFIVTIHCIHHTISRSGKNSSHNQRVVWKKHAAVEYEPSAKGIQLKFKSPVDSNLMASEPKQGRSYYRWVVRIQGHYKQSKLNLDREFDIPVFKLDSPQSSHLHITAPVPQVNVAQISPEQVKIKQNTRSLVLSYPRSRYASIGKGLFAFALIFLAVAGFLAYATGSEILDAGSVSFFSAGITGFMVFVFGLIGLTMLGFAVHLLTNRLEVMIDSSSIRVMSQSLLHHSTQTASLTQISQISKKTSMSSGQGSSAIVYYTIKAQLLDHKILTLGNGIKGQLVADSLIKLIKKQLNSVAVNLPLDAADARSDAKRDDILESLSKVDIEKVAKYHKYFKWFTHIIALIFMLLFAFEFFSSAGFWK